jgi:hypothetical protein
MVQGRAERPAAAYHPAHRRLEAQKAAATKAASSTYLALRQAPHTSHSHGHEATNTIDPSWPADALAMDVAATPDRRAATSSLLLNQRRGTRPAGAWRSSSSSPTAGRHALAASLASLDGRGEGRRRTKKRASQHSAPLL